MKCTSPFKKVIDGVIRELPCGQCMACRLNHARMWSIRISHEASCHTHNVFLTLTYDDEHLPSDGSVHKRDLQLFFKRLRKELKGAKLRYFCFSFCSKNSKFLSDVLKTRQACLKQSLSFISISSLISLKADNILGV